MKDEYNKKADAKVKQVTRFGTTLKRLKEKAGLSQEKLAYAIGKDHRSFIAKLETGETKNMPSLPVLKKIAKALNISIIELFYNVPNWDSYKTAKNHLRELYPDKEPNEKEIYLYRKKRIQDILDSSLKGSHIFFNSKTQKTISFSEEDYYNIFCWHLRQFPFAITLLSLGHLGYEQFFDRWLDDKDRIKRIEEARAKIKSALSNIE